MALFIHIGLHKTGTTSIQTFMSMNAELLERHGLIYPAEGRAKHAHHAISYEFRGDPEQPRKRQGVNAVAEFARAHPDKNILISSEGLDTLHAPEIEKLREAFAGIEIVIIMYVRPYADAIPSKYSQNVKNGSVFDDFDVFLKKTLKGGGGSYFGPYGFLGKARMWAAAFGWEAMEIRALDRSCMVGGDLLTDLLSIFGLSYQELEPEFAPGSTDRHNPSFGWKALELLRALQIAASGARKRKKLKRAAKTKGAERIGKRLRRAANIAVRKIGMPDEKGRYLTREQFDQCNERYDADVAAVNELLVRNKIPARDVAHFTERSFLPTADEVPELERLRFNQTVFFELMPIIGEGMKAMAEQADEEGADDDEEEEEGDDGED